MKFYCILEKKEFYCILGEDINMGKKRENYKLKCILLFILNIFIFDIFDLIL